MWLTAVLLAAVVHANVNPTPRTLGAFYFNGPNESQVWVDLDAQTSAGGSSPLQINVTIKFRGRELKGTPKTATIRATSALLAAPLHVTAPVLKFHLADDTTIDLTGPGSVFSFVAKCDTCVADTLVADLPFSEVEHMASSSVILVEALGFDAKLSQEDVAAIRTLIDAVRDGATVK